MADALSVKLSVKQSAVQMLESLPDNVAMEDIMYELYVLDQIRRGQDAAIARQTTTLDELRSEIAQW